MRAINKSDSCARSAVLAACVHFNSAASNSGLLIASGFFAVALVFKATPGSYLVKKRVFGHAGRRMVDSVWHGTSIFRTQIFFARYRKKGAPRFFWTKGTGMELALTVARWGSLWLCCLSLLALFFLVPSHALETAGMAINKGAPFRLFGSLFLLAAWLHDRDFGVGLATVAVMGCMFCAALGPENALAAQIAPLAAWCLYYSLQTKIQFAKQTNFKFWMSALVIFPVEMYRLDESIPPALAWFDDLRRRGRLPRFF